MLIPGISGSVLAKDGREIWGTSTGAIIRAVTSGGDSIRGLTLTAEDDPDLDELGDGVVATRVIPDLHLIPGLWKIDGYSRTAANLVTRLDLQPGANYFELPYDWRRDNRVAARALARRSAAWLKSWRESSGNTNAKLILVVHSMGGLVARHFLEVLGGWRDTRLLVSFGTPYAGSLKALGYIAKGYGGSLGPIQIDLSEVLRSFSSTYQLLPTYKCLDVGGTLLRLDAAIGVPNLDYARVTAAAAFHRGIAEAQKTNATETDYVYGITPVVGIEQPTFQSAILTATGLDLLTTHPEGDAGGDGTVPRVSATPDEIRGSLREMYIAEAHGSLQNAGAVLDHLYGVLTTTQIDFDRMRLGAPVLLSLYLDDVHLEASRSVFRVRPSRPVPVLRAAITNVEGTERAVELVLRPAGDGFYEGAFALPQGAYRLTVSGDTDVAPVTDTFLVVEITGEPNRPSKSNSSARDRLGSGLTSPPQVSDTQSSVEGPDQLQGLDNIAPVEEADLTATRGAILHDADEQLWNRIHAREEKIRGHELQFNFRRVEAPEKVFHNRKTGLADVGENVAMATVILGTVGIAAAIGGASALGLIAAGATAAAAALRMYSNSVSSVSRLRIGKDDPQIVADLGSIVDLSSESITHILEHNGSEPFRQAPASTLEPGSLIGPPSSDLDPPALPYPRELAGDDERSATRQPSILPIGPIAPGREATIWVDLLRDQVDPLTIGNPVRLADLPEGWTSLKVRVELHSTDIDFSPNEKEIEVVRGAPSKHAVFLGQVRADLPPGASTEIIAMFHHNDRFAGHARRSLVVAGGTGATASPTTLKPVGLISSATAPGIVQGSITIEHKAPAPDLTVKIFHPEGTAEGSYFWTLSVREPSGRLPGKLNGTVALGRSTEAYARALIADCPTLTPPQHLDMLNGIGEQIWSVVPECFRAAYWIMREERPNFSIQFITDDPYVPWELMRPIRGDGQVASILALDHPVARWIAVHEGSMRNRWPAGTVASIAPTYRDPNDFLQWAQAEAARLRAAGALPISGTLKGVLDFFKAGLPDQKVSLVHFAGHGKFGAINGSHLLLEDGVLKPLQLNTSEVMLGRTQQPFMMLNACEVGSLTDVLGGIGGWAEVLSRRQFSGVLAPLWAVYDREASEMASEFITAVWERGERAGEALRRIRADRHANSATPFAYVLYGDVMAGAESQVNA